MKTTHQFRDVRTGEVFTVELECDLNEIAHALAARAHKSKQGKARALNGDIRCKVIARGTQ